MLFRSGGSFEVMDDFDAGFKDADIVYPKSWGALLTTDDNAKSAEIGRKYTNWITDERRMALAKLSADMPKYSALAIARAKWEGN